MTNKLREYIDMVFAQAPQTKKTVEVKEEILQNLLDKYNDLIAEGKSEEAAYNIAIAGLGDISELLRELKGSPYDEEQAAESEETRQKRALFTSLAIAFYVMCVIPPIIFDSVIGIVLMLFMVAGATAILIYNNMTKPRYIKKEATMADDFRQWRQGSENKRAAMRSITGALWSITVAVYFLISFATNAWHVTWIIFLIAAALSSVIKALFDLNGR